MADRKFYILSPTGGRIDFVTVGPGTYGLMLGTYGLGVPPVANRYSLGAGNGGSHRGKKYGMRPFDLAIFIEGTGRADIESKINALAAVVDPEVGLPKLVAEYSDGTIFELPFAYTSGLEIDGNLASNVRYEPVLSLMAPQPFWKARDAVQFTVTVDPDAEGLLPDLAALHLSPSETIGTFTITNQGDVACPITWVITGPGGPASAFLGDRGWEMEDVLVADEVISIVKTILGVTVKDQTDANRYSSMAPAPKFFDLPAGESTIVISLEDATADSSVAGIYYPLRKVIY